MREARRFFGIVVRMYLEDHAPPHIHVDELHADGEELICWGRMSEFPVSVTAPH
jgi:hypothetical protein